MQLLKVPDIYLLTGFLLGDEVAQAEEGQHGENVLLSSTLESLNTIM